uniref:NdhI n=1 Tax=Arundo donax TaxID=35708 RepID=A0A0A8ZUT5_ARUDO
MFNTKVLSNKRKKHTFFIDI